MPCPNDRAIGAYPETCIVTSSVNLSPKPCVIFRMRLIFRKLGGSQSVSHPPTDYFDIHSYFSYLEPAFSIRNVRTNCTIVIISSLPFHSTCLIKSNCSFVSQVQNYNKPRIIHCKVSYQMQNFPRAAIDTRHREL